MPFEIMGINRLDVYEKGQTAFRELYTGSIHHPGDVDAVIGFRNDVVDPLLTVYVRWMLQNCVRGHISAVSGPGEH